MSDAVFFVTVGLLAAGAIALALVWPQGLGARSPAPFGHPIPVQAVAAPPATVPAPAGPMFPVNNPPAPAQDLQLKGAL